MRNFKLIMLTLAALAVVFAGCDREITGDVDVNTNASANCFDCHSDQDWAVSHAQAQFAVSVHATGETVERNRLNASYYSACEKCHTHEGFVANLDDMTADGDYFTTINCFTCHQPHTGGNLQLRVQNAVTLLNGASYDLGRSNICASCHQSRMDVTTEVAGTVDITSTHWGPHHSVQGDMLIGTNGYEYDGYAYSRSWHGQNIDNGCVTCHMAEVGSWGEIGEHTFNVAAGEGEDHIQNIGACTQCHSTFENFNPNFPEAADADYDWDGVEEGVQHEIEGLLDSLATELVAAVLIDPVDHEPIDTVSTSADSAGALYNYLFVEEDRSEGIHNTDYAVGLLQSAINYLVHNDPNGAVGVSALRAERSHDR